MLNRSRQYPPPTWCPGNLCGLVPGTMSARRLCCTRFCTQPLAYAVHGICGGWAKHDLVADLTSGSRSPYVVAAVDPLLCPATSCYTRRDCVGAGPEGPFPVHHDMYALLPRVIGLLRYARPP